MNRSVRMKKGAAPVLGRRGWACFIIAAFLWLGIGSAAHCGELVIGGTGSALGVMQLLGEAYMEAKPQTRILILPSLGSGGGIKALLHGKLGMSLSARPLKQNERDQGLSSAVYAKSPLVFAAHPGVPVDGLTLKDLIAMYEGEAAAWANGAPIRLIMRPPSESATVHLKSLSPRMEPAVDAALQRSGMITAFTDQEAADLLESTPGAVTSLSLGQLLSEKRRVKVLTFEGANPLQGGCANPDYPHFKVYWRVLGPDSPPEALDFVRFISSEKGAGILGETGCIPLNESLEAP